jgi:hypothetical protein
MCMKPSKTVYKDQKVLILGKNIPFSVTHIAYFTGAPLFYCKYFQYNHGSVQILVSLRQLSHECNKCTEHINFLP